MFAHAHSCVHAYASDMHARALVCSCAPTTRIHAHIQVSYFYKNTLKVDPATLTQIMSMTNLPWTCKPIYGFVSDLFPIFGYRRRPYIFLAGLTGCCMHVSLHACVRMLFPALHCLAACRFYSACKLLSFRLSVCMGNVVAYPLVPPHRDLAASSSHMQQRNQAAVAYTFYS